MTASPDTAPLIRFRSVSKTFRRRPVLDSVDLDFATGDRVALVGSNGAGKTTLIRCLLGEYVHAGTVAIGGRDPRRHRREVLRAVGFVPQLPPPLKMPVGELVRFAAKVSGSRPQAMLDVAAALGLEVDQILRQPFVKLSGGQKQKLLIGIALGRDCDVLVMDEPAANLDPESRKVFFDLLADRITLSPMGITAGFNWSGVPEAERRLGATLSQKIGGKWQMQADGPDVLESTGPAVLKADGFDLEDYEVGTNGTLFSPQGGLRASLEELCPLVRTVAVHAVASRPAWMFDPALQNGDTDDGYFAVYGEGPQIHPASDSPVPGVKLIGHHGEAYGLYSGAWHAPDLDAEIAYAITGSGTDFPRSKLHRTVNTWFEPAVRAAGDVLTR